MYALVEKSKENKSWAVANSVAQKKKYIKPSYGFVDNRPENISQEILKKIANNSNDGKKSKDAASLERTKSITQNFNIKHPTGPVAQCQCISCSSNFQQAAAIQRTVTRTGTAADNDNDINTGLGNLDGAGSTTTTGLYNNIATETGMATEDQAKTGYESNAKGIATVGTEIWVEGGTTFYDQVKKDYTGSNVKNKNTRRTRVHSEQHYEHRHATKPSRVWCTVDNCYFCNKQLDHDSIEHQPMKTSHIFPLFWTHPRDSWQIAKNNSGVHNGTGNIWTITSGSKSSKYVNARHTTRGESNVNPG